MGGLTDQRLPGWTSTRLNGKGQPTMADVLASISERQGKGGTR